MPGYISLFQRNNETLGIAKNITENADDHFEELLVSIEKDVNKNRYDVKNPKYRKRTVNTVWYWTDMYLLSIHFRWRIILIVNLPAQIRLKCLEIVHESKFVEKYPPNHLLVEPQ